MQLAFLYEIRYEVGKQIKYYRPEVIAVFVSNFLNVDLTMLADKTDLTLLDPDRFISCRDLRRTCFHIIKRIGGKIYVFE